MYVACVLYIYMRIVEVYNCAFCVLCTQGQFIIPDYIDSVNISVLVLEYTIFLLNLLRIII